jgi:hypothetical protein
MPHTLGFILLTHARPRQMRRLIGTLDAMFEGPRIVCHHDFSKCSLDVSAFPPNVSFVRPHLKTGWADFSVVEATVRALEAMYGAGAPPEWFVVLSGSDYPIKPAASIVRDLAASAYDAYIDHEPIRAGAFEREWQERCYRRYCSVRLARLPFPTRTLGLRMRDLRVSYPGLTDRLLPFSEGLRCYAGSQWFCARRRAAEYIVDFHHSNPRMRRHYRRLQFSEESYFQTILANAPGLKLCNDNLRFLDWSAREPHPKTLGMTDLAPMLRSPAHFARKFDLDHDPDVLDALDEVIGVRCALPRSDNSPFSPRVGDEGASKRFSSREKGWG